ncbi:MAG: hypothetical protein ACJZ1P_03350 [Candidatus Neomarinimicrobiota bacterium]|tara:strand:+ start:243 stop:989 length:747 start_codon:yes stop_codon:yes gene_type:complete
MKKYNYIFFIFLFTSIKSQNTDLDIVKSNIITQFSKIEDYQVDINIKINMTGFRMPKKKIKMFFKKPDKLSIKTNGFAIIPKTGINNNPNELFKMFNYINEVNRTIRDNKQFYFISGIVNQDSIDMPIKNFKSEESNVKMSLLIDAKEWIITEVDIFLDKEKTFSIRTDYININNIMVPEKTKLIIGIKEISRIKNNFNSDLLFNSDNDLAKASGFNLKNDEFKGEISMKFSNYIINQGIDDQIFIRN